MAKFTPPTDNNVKVPFSANGVVPSQEQRLAYRLARHVTAGKRGRNVYKLTDNTYTENQPGDMSTVSKTYYGGHATVITAAEVTSLTAAGYAANIHGEYLLSAEGGLLLTESGSKLLLETE